MGLGKDTLGEKSSELNLERMRKTLPDSHAKKSILGRGRNGHRSMKT